MKKYLFKLVTVMLIVAILGAAFVSCNKNKFQICPIVSSVKILVSVCMEDLRGNDHWRSV